MLRRVAQCLLDCAASTSSACSSSWALGPRSSTAHTFGKLLHESCTGSLQSQSIRSKYTWAFKKAASTPGLIFWKPRTPGLTHKISIDYKALGVYTGAPVPSLSHRKHNTGGRNSHGHITARHRGGGMLKILRDVDFLHASDLGDGVVERIELDPNRSAFIALVRYTGSAGEPVWRYHLAPHGLREGSLVASRPDAPIQTGNRLPLKEIPLGTAIHNIEMRPGGGGQIARAAGTTATIKYKEEQHAVLDMPSGEVRRLPLDCQATIGSVSNPLNKLTIMGKAGVNRQRGRRPKVRGVAMNPVDHPMGGKTAGGRPSCTPWGVYCKGQRTRLRNKYSNPLIITRKGGQPMDKFVNAKKWRAAAERERKAKSGATLPARNPGPSAEMLGPKLPAWGVLSLSVKSGAQALRASG